MKLSDSQLFEYKMDLERLITQRETFVIENYGKKDVCANELRNIDKEIGILHDKLIWYLDK